jgi:hypothetical protein
MLRQVEPWKRRNSRIPGAILALERTLDVFKISATPDTLDKEAEAENRAKWAD